MFRYQRTRPLIKLIQKKLHLPFFVSQKHKSVLQKLQAEFSDVSYVVDVVNKEDVRHIDFKEWKNRILLFKQYGFDDCDCFKIISLYPSILRIPQTNLQSTLQQWVNAELGMRNFQLIIISCPELLTINDSVIRKRLPILRTYFRGVSALSQMIINCPNIMYDEWSQLCSKIEYLLNEKKFKMGDLLKSCALSKDFDFIKLRFYIAEKCGVYKQQNLMPHEEGKHQKSNFQNPKLKYIIQDKDENFAKLVAKITLEEYLAAKDLFLDENKYNSLSKENEDDDLL